MDATLSDRLAQLERELDALRQIKTQEDYDEGARLHAEKNAPWVKGQFSDLKFPPYQYKAFPKVLYHPDWLDARQLREEALIIPARGIDDDKRAKAIILAERLIEKATKTVHNDAERIEWLNRGWFESPQDAEKAKQAAVDAMATGQAHREYEDRNMGDVARREAQAFDDAAETFTPEIPAQKIRPHRKKATAPAPPAA